MKIILTWDIIKNMKRLIKTLALIAALSSVLNAVSLLTAGAQSTSNIVTLRGSSVSPLPKQVFTITANTPLYKPQEAIFNWTVNGRLLASDSGRCKDSISVLAGAVGSSIIAEVEVTHLERDPASATLEFIIMDLALTWSAKTYVPKWYKGKPLPSASSIARVTAVPNVVIDGRRLGPKELIFTWDLGIQRRAVSGPGEDSVELQVSDIPNNGYRIYVTVEDLEKRVQQGAARTVRPLLPKLVTYALSPLGGVEPRSSLKTAIIKEHEARDFVAEPFF